MTERTVLEWTLEEEVWYGGKNAEWAIYESSDGTWIIQRDFMWSLFKADLLERPTLDEAKACAQRIQDAIDGYDRLEEVIAKIEAYRQSVEAEIADDDEELARLGELAALRRALDLLRETR